MLSFKELEEKKKTNVKINPKLDDLKEKTKHGEDCTCIKCDKRRENDEGDDGPTVESYRVLARDKGDKGRPAQFSYKDENDAKKFADSIKSKGGKATVHKEGVLDEGGSHKVHGTYDGKKVSGTYLKLPARVAKGVKRDSDERDPLGKAKDAVTDALGMTNTKRDGVKKPEGIKGFFSMQNSHKPKGEMVEGVMDIVKRYRKKQKQSPHKYPEGTKYKDPADAAKKKLKVRAQKAVGIFPDAADENPERRSSK